MRLPLVIGGLTLLAAVATLLPYDVIAAVDAHATLQPPSAAHWLGTDSLGRDVAWRLLLATRNFVPGGLVAAAISALLGTVLGVGAGWRPGVLATLTQQLLDALSALPRLVLVLFACMIAGQGRWIGAIAAGVALTPPVARAVEARLTALRRAEFVEALRVHGIAPARILLFHVLWANTRRDVLREAANTFGAWLIIEASLSYLGSYGVPEPEPSWGNMIALAFAAPPGNVWAGLAPAIALGLAAALVRPSEAQDG